MIGCWVVGYEVTEGDGSEVGSFDCSIEGDLLDKTKVGSVDGRNVSAASGDSVGYIDVIIVGSVDGNSVGTTVDECDGYPVRYSDDSVREGTVDGW